MKIKRLALKDSAPLIEIGNFLSADVRRIEGGFKLWDDDEPDVDGWVDYSQWYLDRKIYYGCYLFTHTPAIHFYDKEVFVKFVLKFGEWIDNEN